MAAQVELCAGDSLANILSQDGYLPEKHVKQFGIHVVQALVYLHAQQDIVYGDMCPENVFLRYKASKFGPIDRSGTYSKEFMIFA